MCETKYIASVSFGKDSLAMLLLLIEKRLPLDEVIFYDTGMEFQAIYNTRDRILPLLHKHGIQYTELHPPRPFVFDMFDKPVNSKKTVFTTVIPGVAAVHAGEQPQKPTRWTPMSKSMKAKSSI